MDINYENTFVHNFINKRYRDRLLFELNSDKKRAKAIDRFSHDAESLIKADKIFAKGNISRTILEHELQKRKFAAAYVLSSNYLQGVSLPIEEALAYFEDECMPVIMIFSSDFAVIKTEFEFVAEKYILSNSQ